MICPECGEPTAPGPLDAHRLADDPGSLFWRLFGQLRERARKGTR
jgi:hypothetical protein